MTHDTAADCATRWYGTHQPQYLSRDREHMVDACTTHLCDVLTMADASARQIAMQVLAEIEAEAQDIHGFVDIYRSTSRLIVVRDSNSRTFHMITLPELFALVASRQQSRATA